MVPVITIAIPLFSSSTAIGIVGPLDVLGKACLIRDNLRGRRGGKPFFRVVLVGLDERPVAYPNGVTLRPHLTIRTCRRPDVLLIPSVDEDLARSIPANARFVPWLKQCHRRGSTLASLCTGAFMLGETGLLDGREATTHWYFAAEFSQRYPRVNLHAEKLIVDGGRLVTAGAGTSFLNLALYLVEKYCGHEVATMSAKLMLIDPGRASQLPYAEFSGARAHGDPAVLTAQDLVERDYARPLSPREVARKSGLGERTLARRFKRATGHTLVAYLQQVRIGAAKRRLERDAKSVDEIRHEVGYEDARAFRRLFRRHTGLTPRAYRAKFAPAPGRHSAP